MSTSLKIGDKVQFYGNRSRGGHPRVYATVTKVNRKTFNAVEDAGSHDPGTLYRWPMSELLRINDVPVRPTNDTN